MMKSRTLAALALMAILASCGSSDPQGRSASGADSRPSVPLDDVCEIFDARPHWKTAALRAESKWGTPVEVQMAILWRESRFQAFARNPASSAFGFPQAINSTWKWYQTSSRNRYGERSNFADSADFVGWYTTRTKSANGVALDNAYHQYLAYHEGHTGYKRGDYRKKPALLSHAAQVQAMSDRYARQLKYCG